MKTYLEKNNYNNIIIESSPYLRALQTAKEAAKELGIKTIKINYLLSEWMKGKFFTSNPIGTLLIRNKKQYTITKYLDGIDVEDVELENCENDMSQDQKDYWYVYNSFPE